MAKEEVEGLEKVATLLGVDTSGCQPRRREIRWTSHDTEAHGNEGKLRPPGTGVEQVDLKWRWYIWNTVLTR